MSYYDTTPVRDHIQKITPQEAEQYIPLKEDYTGIRVNKCPYYTVTQEVSIPFWISIPIPLPLGAAIIKLPGLVSYCWPF